jgi:hypothetical protein
MKPGVGAGAVPLGFGIASVIFWPSFTNQRIRRQSVNEDHVIAAIIAAGMIARKSGEELSPTEAVSIYGECLSELIEANRPKREFAADAVAE